MRRLNKEQKGAIFLLQIGTFLEYFDLMLFVHMAVVLNEIFFPKFDPFTNSLLSAFTFCSTFALKPIGALLFGYIGDKVCYRRLEGLCMCLCVFYKENAGMCVRSDSCAYEHV